MSILSPMAVARALQVVSACGGVLALVFSFALFDEYRTRRAAKQQPPDVTVSQLRSPDEDTSEPHPLDADPHQERT